MSLATEQGRDSVATPAIEERKPNTGSIAGALLQSGWFYAALVLGVTAGPLLIPGVSVRELFVTLTGASVVLYALLMLAGIVTTLRESKRAQPRSANRR